MTGREVDEPRILVVGIGTRDRGDDAVGLRVATALRGRLSGIRILEHAGEVIDLFAAWRDQDAVFLADAVVSGAAPGTITRVDATREPLVILPRCLSSHWLGLDQVVDLARRLDLLPDTLVIYGIEAGRFEIGSAMRREVAAAVPGAAARIAAEIRALRAGGARRRPATVPGR